MKTSLLFQDAASFAAPMTAVFAVDIATGKDTAPLPTLLVTTDAISDAASRFLTGGEFKATLGETLLLHAPAGLKCERLLIVGLGKATKLTPKQVRVGAGAAVRQAKAKEIRSLAIAFPEDRALSDEAMEDLPKGLTARAIAEGILMADFDAATYRSKPKVTAMTEVSVVVPAALETQQQNDVRSGFEEGVVLGESVNFVQALVNEPGNVLTPTELGRRAKAMCEEAGLACDVHSTEKLRELKMGAFLGVAQGSAEPPALIVMRYEPASAPKEGAPVIGLVGKGITFDTGGISIKPADGMEKMKYDMAGAAAMLGAMRAIAKLKPAVRVIGVVCSAENMPGSKAYKPGDVLTAMSGETIEIINTDAEGRLVLADGLHYAKTLGATHLIDAATLTGACVVALGTSNSGLFSNDEETCDAFLRAMRRTGESFWRLPCTEEYREFVKSDIADIRNTGMNRWGGAITAAMFLKDFAGDTPWVHLDIAGQAWLESNTPAMGKGPSGVATRTIVEWVRELAF